MRPSPARKTPSWPRSPGPIADILAVLLITTSRLYAMSSSVIDDDDAPLLEVLGNVQARAVRLLADLVGCDLRSFAGAQYARHGADES